MEQENNLTSDTQVSPTENQSYVDNSSPVDRIADFLNDDTSIPQESSDVEVNEAPVEDGSEVLPVEEVDATDETPEEDNSEDEVVEVEDQDAPDSDTDDVEGYVDYEDTKGKLFPVKVNGEVKYMTFDEMQNDVARATSANKKTTEAKETLEMVDKRTAEAEAKEEAVKKREQLLGANAQLQLLTAKFREAKQAGNTEEANAIAGQYTALEGQIKQTQDQHYNEYVDTQIKAIAESSYSYLLDKAKSKDFSSFVGTLSANTQYAVNHDAELMQIAEDARKWRDSQKKGKATKLPVKKSIPDSKVKAPNKQKQKIANQRKEFASGKPSHKTRTDTLSRIGDFLNN